MARMLGRVRPSWCPACKTPPGPDCPDTARSPRQVRHVEQRALEREFAALAADPDMVEEIAFYADRAHVSRLWAEDWDSPEDAVYD